MVPEPYPPRITMREIAERLGVSHATVSMALRNNPRISTAMREKVKLTAAELSYRPDPMLNALVAYRNSKSPSRVHSEVAWINAWVKPKELRAHKEFDLYWKGASECAAKFGYFLEEFRVTKQMPLHRLHKVFQERHIRGILLPPHRLVPPEVWQDFPWENYSVVRFGRSVEFPPAHVVTADQFANTFIAVSKMRARGYHRIGLITCAINLDTRGPHFTAGFLSAREMFGDMESFPIFCIEQPVNDEVIARFRQWMEEKKPDALLSTVDPKILLRGSGYRVPQDVAMAVTSVLDGGADGGTDQHAEEIGRAAFLLLNSEINNGSRGIPKTFRQILVEGSWVDGASLPDRRRMISNRKT